MKPLNSALITFITLAGGYSMIAYAYRVETRDCTKLASLHAKNLIADSKETPKTLAFSGNYPTHS